MPDSNDRILPQATPVPTTIANAIDTAMTRRVRAGISPGYLRKGRRVGSAGRRARLVTMAFRETARIVISGAGGMVGRELAAQARSQGRDVLALTSSEWDITDAPAAERFIEPGDVVINCAAYTKVDAAESDEARAHAVNAVGPANIAHACARAGAEFIHISTDYVFSGAKGQPVRDRRRDRTEGRVRPHQTRRRVRACSRRCPTRTSSERRGSTRAVTASDFVATMRRLAAGDQTVDVVADQIGSPTYAADLVGALLEVAEGNIREPLLHAANAGEASRFEQAQAVFEAVGADPARVRPVGSDRHPRPAPRPRYSALSARLSAEAGLTPLRPWRDALAAALAKHAH